MGLSQAAVADELDVSRVAVVQWESGRSRPTVENAWGFIELAGSYGIRMRLEDIFPQENGE